MELYKKYRPKELSDVVGQANAVREIESFFKKDNVPHCILLEGPSGVGKTTIGRILRRRLKCSKLDYHEEDCPNIEKPLDFVREMNRSTKLHPMGGKVSVWFLEEFQSLSRAGFSQQALLKLIEDCKDHVYFILATTDPDKIQKALRSRATRLRLSPVDNASMNTLLARVIKAEGLKIPKDVVESIVESAEGGARKALVILEQVAGCDSEDEMMEAVDKASENKEQAFKLAQAMMFGRPDWNNISKILRDISGEDAEQMRYLILSYARTCLIGKDGKPPNTKIAPRAYAVIDVFSSNFYDSKHAGLAAACWEIANPE